MHPAVTAGVQQFICTNRKGEVRVELFAFKFNTGCYVK